MLRVLLLYLCAIACLAACPASLSAGEHERHVTVGGQERTFYVYVPKGMPTNPRPGVVMLHGCGSSPEKFEKESLMAVNAEGQLFYTVYPKGTSTGSKLGWNAGPGAQCSTGGLVNDVDFIRAVVLDMIDNLCLDTDRLFAAGFSNGGQMTFNLTCTMPDVFAAFSISEIGQPSATKSCGITSDQIRPMLSVCGSADFACQSTYSSWIGQYATASSCTGQPSTKQVSNTTSLTSYGDCGANHKLPFDAYLIEGLGHCWSGNNCCDSQCDNQNPGNIDTSAILLSFFESLPTKKGLGPEVLANMLRSELSLSVLL